MNLILKKTFWLIAFLSVAFGTRCQEYMCFKNLSKNQIILAKPGDQLSLVYRGYLGQTETFKHNILLITDSSVILGIPSAMAGEMLQKLDQKHVLLKEILFKDIISFRRMSPGRNLLKATLTLGSAIGSIFLLQTFSQNEQLSNIQGVGVSFGTAILSRFLINLALPDHPKYLMKDGWSVESVKQFK